MQYPGNEAYEVPRVPPPPRSEQRKATPIWALFSGGLFNWSKNLFANWSLFYHLISVAWRPDIFSLLAKTVRFSSPSQQGAFVKSRFSILCMEYLRTTNLPSIMQPCGKLLRHLKVTFFYAFWIQIWFSRPEGGRVLQLFAWLNLIWFGFTADMKGAEFESVIFMIFVLFTIISCFCFFVD